MELLCAICCGDLSFSSAVHRGEFQQKCFSLPYAARAFDSVLPPLSFLCWMLLLNHPAGQVNASHEQTLGVF